MPSPITEHGRATPLVWLTVDKKTLKDQRNPYEDRLPVRLAEILPPHLKVRIIADRGFGDHKRHRLLSEQLHFDYVIRFGGNILVTAADGEARTAASWVGTTGRARILRCAKVTAERHEVGTVVCVREKDMKPAWCLATNSTDETAKDLTRFYGARWGIESELRDTKDLRFGMGMGAMRVNSPERRARLWLAQRLCRGAAHRAGRCRRGAWIRSAAEIKPRRTPHPLVVPPGLHALRPDPHHAGRPVAPVDGNLRRHGGCAAAVHERCWERSEI